MLQRPAEIDHEASLGYKILAWGKGLPDSQANHRGFFSISEDLIDLMPYFQMLLED